MKAILTVIGKDKVGIIAAISNKLSKLKINILDVNQTILDGYFTMMMMLDYSPAFAQIVYRIGDSTTNAITPIYPYIPIAIGMAKKYDKNFGMGSLISMMLPYSIAFLIVWVIQMIVWVLFNLPLGPGVSVFL